MDFIQKGYDISMGFLSKWIVEYKTLLKGICSTMFLFIAIMFFMDKFFMPLYTRHGKDVELPDVEYIPFEEAKKILESKRLRIVFEEKKFDATYPESTVIFQNPRPFSRVKRGRRIYVTLSAGEKMVQVPRVIGMAERDAVFKLRDSGLQVGEIFYEYSDYWLNGVVCDQSYPEGAEVVEQGVVDITVSLGRLPSRFVVPNVIGKSLETAKKVILQAGLKVGTVTYEVRDQLIPDTVIRQSIESDEEVSRGQSIDLVVSQLEGAL
jgi:beta-lactam-binding protein with PASTA domain